MWTIEHIHDHSLSLLGTGTLIKGVRLVETLQESRR